jgi:3-hydroxymyristoyl/3-hydroxydecanoyl-(acyl carrier protein) dehydratase
VRSVRGIGKFDARARVGETLVTEAQLMCTIKEQ